MVIKHALLLLALLFVTACTPQPTEPLVCPQLNQILDCTVASNEVINGQQLMTATCKQTNGVSNYVLEIQIKDEKNICG